MLVILSVYFSRVKCNGSDFFKYSLPGILVSFFSFSLQYSFNTYSQKWNNLVASGYLLALALFLCVMFGCAISSIPEIYTEVSSSWFIS